MFALGAQQIRVKQALDHQPVTSKGLNSAHSQLKHQPWHYVHLLCCHQTMKEKNYTEKENLPAQSTIRIKTNKVVI